MRDTIVDIAKLEGGVDELLGSTLIGRSCDPGAKFVGGNVSGE